MIKVYLAIIVALIGFFRWDHGVAYDAGYSQATIDIRKKSDKAMDDIKIAKENEIEIKRKQLDIAVKESREWQKKVDEINKLLNKKPRERIVYVDKQVEKIVQSTGCSDLGNDFMQLWNGR